MSDSFKRVIRTFLIAFLGIFIPGALGFMNDVTSWATNGGQQPFPDMHSVAYLGVSALSAAMIAVLNYVWNLVEDKTGKGLLRDTPPAGD